MPFFRKKPVIIEAVEFTGHNVAEIADLLGWTYSDGDEYSESLVIETLEGEMTAHAGDWVIKGLAGEGYPCKPDIFEQSYEPVEEP